MIVAWQDSPVCARTGGKSWRKTLGQLKFLTKKILKLPLIFQRRDSVAICGKRVEHLLFVQCVIYFYHVDPCEKVTCKGDKVCRRKRIGKGECECPQCQPVYDFVCGTDDRTYASACFLKKHACLFGKTIGIKAKKPCGKSIVHYIFLSVLKSCSEGAIGKSIKD